MTDQNKRQVLVVGSKGNLHLQTFVETRVNEISIVGPNAIDRTFEVVKNIRPEDHNMSKPANWNPLAADVTLSTSVTAKALELHGRDIAAFADEMYTAVAKSTEFGDSVDPWDYYVRSIGDAEVVVQNWKSGAIYLAAFESKSEGEDLAFVFTDVGKAQMRYERIDAAAVAKSLGGVMDDADWGAANLVNAKAVELIKKNIDTPVSGASDAKSILAAKAKRLTSGRIDQITEARDALDGLLSEVVDAPEVVPEETPDIESTKGSDGKKKMKFKKGTEEFDAEFDPADLEIDVLVNKALEVALGQDDFVATLRDSIGIPGVREEIQAVKAHADQAIEAINGKLSTAESGIVAATKSIDELASTSDGPRSEAPNEPTIDTSKNNGGSPFRGFFTRKQ